MLLQTSLASIFFHHYRSQFFRALCLYFCLNCLRQSTFWIHEWWRSLEISTQVTSSHSYNVIASGFFISPIGFLTHLCWPQSKVLLYCFRWFLKVLIILTSNTCNFHTSIQLMYNNMPFKESVSFVYTYKHPK